MNRFVLVWVAALGLAWGGVATTAHAQYSPYPLSPYSNQPGLNPGGGPRLSPYLNLRRNGVAGTAIDYYLGVVPEIDRRANQYLTRQRLQQIEQQVNQVQTEVEGEELVPQVPSTGHVVQFMNTAPYYNLGPASRTGMATPLPPPPSGARRPRGSTPGTSKGPG